MVKPRLESLTLTDEDADIWLSIVCVYMEDWATVGVIFRESDRRDADLMHWAQSQRWIQIQDGVSHYGGPLRLFDRDLGGEAQR